MNLFLCKVNFRYQRVLYTQFNTYSYCDPRYKNMLVCLHPGIYLFIFFWVHLSSQIFFSFTDGQGSINTYLLNLILKLFALLHLVCLVFLQCACYHYEFSSLKSIQSAISRLVALSNLFPQLSSLSVSVDGMMVQLFSERVD